MIFEKFSVYIMRFAAELQAASQLVICEKLMHHVRASGTGQFAVEVGIKMLQKDDADQRLGPKGGPARIEPVLQNETVDQSFDSTWVAASPLDERA
jgi:hypothetical protein